MDTNLIRKINQTDWTFYFAITGGGASFIGDFLAVSGASRVVRGANVPYSQIAFDKFVKSRVDSYASEEAARRLAVAAYMEARFEDKPVGVGMACSLAKDNERAGRMHTINMAIHTAESTGVFTITLQQGRTRLEEDKYAADILLQYIAHFLKIEGDLKPLPLRENEFFSIREAGNPEYSAIVNGWGKNILYTRKDDPKEKLLIYPGSWNPIHDGHKEIAKLAEEIIGETPILELAVTNADKGPLDYIDIENRVKGLNNNEMSYILTAAPTFVEKVNTLSTFHPNKDIVFIVGMDTWNRIWDEKFGWTTSHLKDIFFKNSVKFLVFPREGHENKSYAGVQFRITDKRLENFSNTLSSSALRKKKYATNA